MKTKPARFYVPENLYPTMFRKDELMFAYYFLNLLHWKWICWQANERGYIPLKYEYLTRVIPRKAWFRIFHRLMSAEVIEIDLVRQSGQCRGYRLANDYRKSRLILCTDDAFNQKLHRIYTTEQKPWRPVHKWLLENLERLQFDEKRARRIITKMQPDPNSKMSVSEYRQQLMETSKRIAGGDLSLTVDRFGRVHTPITSLAKELRPCLSSDGQSLVNIDLANSQPLIAGLVACQYHSNRTTAHNLKGRVFQDGKTPPRCFPRSADTDRKDLQKFLAVCEAGHLYESMMKQGDDRENIKRSWLTAMYGENHWRGRLKDRLERLYPSVASMLKGLKRTNYKHAAHVIQNVEASIFIYGIAGRIMQERTNLPVWTIHDSIVTTDDNVSFVRGVIKKVFRKLSVSPLLKKEKFQ